MPVTTSAAVAVAKSVHAATRSKQPTKQKVQVALDAWIAGSKDGHLLKGFVVTAAHAADKSALARDLQKHALAWRPIP